MLKVVSSRQMREMDRHTIEDLGVPGVVLMENAGVGTYRVIQELLSEVPDPLVYVFSGKGNNGGDGFVVARHLWDAGVRVKVIIAGSEADLKGDALINYRIVRNFEIPVLFVQDEAALQKATEEVPDLIVDALLGTGIQGVVRGFMKTVIEHINRLSAPVVAVDVPSGVNADLPVVEGEAVRAVATVTMALPKPCHLFYPARQYVGELFIADIGIPHTVRQSREVHFQLVEAADIRLPVRQPDAHKYRVGKVAVLAGSPGYTGAAALCADAALRMGAGLVILGVPEELNPILETKLTEVITRPYPTGGAAFLNEHSRQVVEELLEWCDVLAIGPGLGRSEDTRKQVVEILQQFDKPAVLDADALFALAQHPELLEQPHPQWVLTPHHGEFQRFLPKVDRETFRKEFPQLAQQFAREKQVTLLLKGAPSLVAAPDGEVYINPTGNAGLASGGTGDVLTGLVAGLLAQGMEPVPAAYTANYLHGYAADKFVEAHSQYTLTAGELISQLNVVLKEFPGAK